MKLVWSVFAAVAFAQTGKGKAPVTTTVAPPAAQPQPKNTPAAVPQAKPGALPISLSQVDAATEKKSILAMQVQSSIEHEAEVNKGNIKGTVVDLVLESLSKPVNATCLPSSKDYLTCANGYVSLDCVFQQAAASFGGVNCIPYLSQCADELLKYCQSKVPADQKCKSKTACECAQENGCGWSRGHLMCLQNREQVSCGDCPTMARCGKIDCPAATRPCDCASLGGMCGWSTSSWRCEAGKDTDCNECAEQTECGGPGLTMVHADACPQTMPSQLSTCHDVMTCPYDKKCCKRCAGLKQVCSETQAECDGQTWELRSSPLVCPDCHDYYYDEAYYDENVPSEPRNVTATQLTATSVVVTWLAPIENFKAGVDGYSVAYAVDAGEDEKVTIMDTTTNPRATVNNLVPNTKYRVSILPVVNATETVGIAGTLEFKTPAAAQAAAGKKKKGKVTTGKTAKAGKVGKAPAPTPKAKARP